MTDTTIDMPGTVIGPADAAVGRAGGARLDYVPAQATSPRNGGIIPMSLRSVHFVMPGGVDDPAAPSGGNAYDRRVCLDLPGFGWRAHRHTVAGDWPRPDAAARAELARTLRELPDGAVVLLDGLVACGVPEIVVPQAEEGRLRMAVLVHLPLGDETGLGRGRRRRTGRPRARGAAGGARRDRHQRLGRTAPGLPPRPGPRPRPRRRARRRHRAPRARHRRRLAAVVRGPP
ncbi:hypothetical protein GCM10023238_03270 [Streptomyces heliomycini]